MTVRGEKRAFTLAESIVSVAILALVLYGSINAYFGFDQNSESVKARVRAELFSRYLHELVDANPPGTGSVSPVVGTPFFLSVSPTGTVSYSQNPAQRTAETGFFPGNDGEPLSHEIAIVATGSSYGKTFVSYRIKATYGSETRTAYLTK